MSARTPANVCASLFVLLLLCAAGSGCCSTAVAHDREASQAAFKELSSLAGEWEGTFPNGRKHHVSYRLTAGGSALMEVWALAPGRESITIYHMDGDALVATHYCPQGNQPCLEMVDGPDPRTRKLVFRLRDGANLGTPGKSHQRSFWVELPSSADPAESDTFTRSETYVKNGSTQREIQATPEGEPITYRRLERLEKK